MAKIISNKPSTLQLLERGHVEGSKRTYLGMSALGNPCDRFLWFQFRWAFTSEFTPRQMRLFNRGHREEPVMNKELEKIGIYVHGLQAEFTDGWGHIKGHCDGMVDNVPEAPKTTHLLEQKTMADKYFNELCKKQLEKSNPEYFGQCQVGMYGFKLTRTLFMAVNKNNDAYYIERIKYNKDIAHMLIKRGKRIILSERPDPPMFKPTWYKCKWCDARNICHFEKALNRNCRTCEKIQVAEGGMWMCGLNTSDPKPLDTIQQAAGCQLYQPIEVT